MASSSRLRRAPMVAAICTAWLLQASLAFHVLRDVFGEEEVEGSPRWRCAFGTLNQLIFLPAFFIIARISQGSIGEWEQTRLLEQLWQARKAAHAAAERFERMATEMATESRAAGGRMAAAASAGGERIAARGQAVVAEGHAAAERMAGAGAAACGRSVDFAERLAASGFGAAERMALKAAEQVRTTFAEAAPAPRQPAP